MQKLKVVSGIIICCLFLNINSFAIVQPVIKITVNKTNAVIGRVIALDIFVKAGKNTRVSWQLCDGLFKQSQQVVLLGINSPVAAGGYFKHVVEFTCIKPNRLLVNALPVLINNQKKFTPSFQVDFKSDRLPLKLHDIKPVENISWFYPLKALLWACLLLLALILLLIRTYFIFKKWINSIVASTARKNCLRKLATLELAAEQDRITAAALVIQVVDLLNRFLQKGISYPDKQAGTEITEQYYLPVHKFRETANRLRFLPQPAARLLYPAFISDVKEFILACQPAPSK